jgi:hypothetical protein
MLSPHLQGARLGRYDGVGHPPFEAPESMYVVNALIAKIDIGNWSDHKTMTVEKFGKY